MAAVSAGQAIFGPSIAARLLSLSVSRDHVPATVPALTDREREMLRIVATGRDNAAIARDLVISQKTVANHVSNILAKLHFQTRAQAIVAAREAGLAGDAGGAR